MSEVVIVGAGQAAAQLVQSLRQGGYTGSIRMIGDERQAIFFVGYADPDTPGGRLKGAKQGQTFVFSASGGEVTKRCEIQDFDLTAHANRDELLDFVGQVSPRTVLLGHGDPDSRQWFEEQIRARHPKIKIIQPGPGKSVEVSPKLEK